MKTFPERIALLGQTDPSIPADEVMLSRMTIMAARQIRRGMNAALAPLDLDYPQYIALKLIQLSVHDGLNSPAGPSDLADILDMSRTQATRLVDELEQKALLQRKADGGDRRRTLLVLTSEGKKRLRQAQDSANAAHLQLWENISAVSKKGLLKLLQQLELNSQQLLAGANAGETE